MRTKNETRSKAAKANDRQTTTAIGEPTHAPHQSHPVPQHYVAPLGGIIESVLPRRNNTAKSEDTVDDPMSCSLLIIEDFDGIRAYLSRFFEREGYEVFSASSLKAAISLMHALTPDIIIVDFDLGSENPFELISRTRALLPDTPIVLIGGHDTEFNRLRVERAGIKYFVPKAYDIKRIESIVEELTKRRMLVQPRDNEPTYE